MLRKLLLPFLFIALFANMAFAQTGGITGTVTNEDGQAVPTANVLLVEIGRGVATNLQGKFNIDNVAPGTYTLRVTFIGYNDFNTEVTIESGSTLTQNVVLKQGAIGLEELVVTGYGVESKIEYTGSASSVDVSSQIEKVPVTNVGKALQGSVTGLNITASSGTPGSPVDINIRGVTSINAGGSPLIVLDGIPVNGGTSQFGLSSSQGLLSSINPQTIADVTVLKGPVATAQYGAQGANGVVVITTKRGTAGETKYSVSYQRGVASRATAGPEVLDAADHVMLYKEGLINAAEIAHETDPTVVIPTPGDIGTPWWDGTTNSNWKDLITNDSPITQTFSISASGGVEQATFFGSLDYQNAESVVKGSGFERFSGTFNFSYDFNEDVSINNQLTGSFSTLNGIREGSSYFANPITAVTFLPQIAPAFNEDGSPYIGSLLFTYSPLYVIDNDISRTRNYRLINSTELDIDLTDNLTFLSEAGFDYSLLEEKTYSNPVHSWGADLGGFARGANNRVFVGTFQNGLNYIWDINDDNSINARVIGEAKIYKYYQIVAAGQGFATLGLTNVSSAATPVNSSTFVQDGSLLSLIGKAKYSYKDKIFVDGTIRQEGNSRFSPGYRWGTFYGIGAGWLLSSENFLSNVDAIDLLKIRASFGVTGNNAIGRNRYQAFLGFGSAYANQGAITPDQLGNIRLTWEKKKALEVGLTLGLFNKLDIDVSAFKTKSYDLLYNVPLSQTTGFNQQVTNVGELDGKGIEISLDLDVIQTEDLLVSFNTNFTYVTNEVVELPTDATGEELTLEGSRKYTAVEGYAVGTWSMKTWAGVNKANGMPLWELGREPTQQEITDGDAFKLDRFGNTWLTSSYTLAGRIPQGASGAPTHYGSVGLRINYKGFYAGASLYGSFGNKVYDVWARYQNSDGQYTLPFFSSYKTQLARWQQPGDITDVPRRINGGNHSSYNHSSRYLYDGDYLRLQTVRVGYQIPATVIDNLNIGVRGVNVYVIGRNLWTKTFDDELKWDPQTGDSGNIDLYNQAQKAFTAGIEIQF